MRNTPLIVMRILLVTFGTAALCSRELIFGKCEAVVEIGPFTVTADWQQAAPLPPIFGGIGMVCGAVMIAVGARKK